MELDTRVLCHSQPGAAHLVDQLSARIRWVFVEAIHPRAFMCRTRYSLLSRSLKLARQLQNNPLQFTQNTGKLLGDLLNCEYSSPTFVRFPFFGLFTGLVNTSPCGAGV